MAGSGSSVWTKIGPESRVHPRLVGKRRNCTDPSSRPTRSRMRRAAASRARESTRRRTVSPVTRCRTISPYTHGMGPNLPGQSVVLCGQPSHVATCRSHSAGMRYPSAVGESTMVRHHRVPRLKSRLGAARYAMNGDLRLSRRVAAGAERRLRTAEPGPADRTVLVRIAEEALVDADVSVYAPVAQERPVAPYVLETLHVERSDEYRFRIGRCLGEDHAEGIGEERMPPELETGTLAVELLESDAVHRGDVAAVGDRMAALDGAPRVELLRSVLCLLRGMPPDRRGIAEHGGALQRRQPRTLGIPLVPADERADASRGGVERLEAEVAGGEIELLVVGGIVGDVHLAVNPSDLAVGVENRRGVVVQSWSPALEQRRDDHDLELPGDLP